MPFYTIPLIVATVASGATAALHHFNARLWRRRCRALETQQQLHLQTIFNLNQQLQDARAVHPHR